MWFVYRSNQENPPDCKYGIEKAYKAMNSPERSFKDPSQKLDVRLEQL